ncbi:MAG: hypothetical protein ABJL67_11995 [Sulfitobacter sp.]
MEFWFLLVALAAFGLILWLQSRAVRRQGHRPLSTRQPDRNEKKQAVPLGMEALDLEAVSRATRRNESLERGQTNWLTKSGFFGRADTDVAPLADDETYAARFHTAFHKEKTKD